MQLVFFRARLRIVRNRVSNFVGDTLRNDDSANQFPIRKIAPNPILIAENLASDGVRSLPHF
jgi:hypothetical protein